MTDKKDFINYFRKASAYLDKGTAAEPEKDQRVELIKNRINEYLQLYPRVNPETIRNLIELKDITQQPKQVEPDDSYENIKSRLHDAESGETLRHERWHERVRCIKCGSKNIKRLPETEQKTKDIYRYKCLDCENCFNDDSSTEMEKGTPPLHSWMLCWYLLGCTNSKQYIANKLKLDVSTVELMIAHMQKLFNANQPLNNFLTFEDFLHHGKNHQNMLKESLQKKEEMLRGYALGAAKDQHEIDRQTKHRNQPPKNRGS